PPPAPLPPPRWDPRDAQELAAFIQQVGAEGLDPADYDVRGLVDALASGNEAAISAAATDRFNRVSADLALGHVRGAARQDWHVTDNDLDEARQDLLLRTALQQHRVGDALTGLLPMHPQYAQLRTALQVTPRSESAKINRIRLNMDRWRWLPRDLGERYIIVNVPAYTAALVENGETTSRHRAVAGATKTPTPQFSTTATGVIVNPWWEIPKSIEPEVRGKAGYVPVKGQDGKVQRWRQPPGPRNALGQVKFVMPNRHVIYLHDTAARGLFDTRARAYSHGCIRTEHIMKLATKLATDGSADWTPDKVKAALDSRKTTQIDFPAALPVYVVYMSSAATVDGKIVDYADIYKRDGKVIAALLNDRRPQNANKAAAKVIASR
ncbi:MAG: L,D-transpeptidase family protein, partial [Pseudomonadota bacterium]|nr:L,D-transpeptidase family protein [Pseudomonadota bacterium]